MPAKKIRALEPVVTPWPMLRTISGWKTRAAMAAATTDRARTPRAGILRQIRNTVSAGTSRSQGVRWKDEARVAEYTSMATPGSPPWVKPSTVNTTSVMTNDGTVVRYI